MRPNLSLNKKSDDKTFYLSVIYVDPFSRYDKRCIDCHFTVQCGKQLTDRYQNPIIVVSLSCGNNSNGLITHDELTTLFHEMGHAIHSILARTRYQVPLTTKLADGLCGNHRPWNGLWGKLFRWIDSIFFRYYPQFSFRKIKQKSSNQAYLR